MTKTIEFLFCFFFFKQDCLNSIDPREPLFRGEGGIAPNPGFYPLVVSLWAQNVDKKTIEFMSTVNEIFGNHILGKPVIWIGYDYIGSKLNKIQEFGIINDAQYDEVMAKINVSVAYSIGVIEQATKLKNYEKLQAVISKEQQSRLSEINEKVRALSTEKFKKIGPKITKLAVSKHEKSKKLAEALLDLFGKQLPILGGKSENSFEVMQAFDNIKRDVNVDSVSGKFNESKKGECVERFKTFSQKLDKYIETVKSESDCEKVKDELNSRSDAFGENFALLHEVFYGLPSEMLEIVNGEETGKKDGKGEKAGEKKADSASKSAGKGDSKAKGDTKAKGASDKKADDKQKGSVDKGAAKASKGAKGGSSSKSGKK